MMGILHFINNNDDTDKKPCYLKHAELDSATWLCEAHSPASPLFLLLTLHLKTHHAGHLPSRSCYSGFGDV